MQAYIVHLIFLINIIHYHSPLQLQVRHTQGLTTELNGWFCLAKSHALWVMTSTYLLGLSYLVLLPLHDLLWLNVSCVAYWLIRIFFYWQVTRAESLFTLMVAKHNCSFSLADHFTKLAPVMFPDSEIAKRYGSRRTKTSSMIRSKA